MNTMNTTVLHKKNSPSNWMSCIENLYVFNCPIDGGHTRGWQPFFLITLRKCKSDFAIAFVLAGNKIEIINIRNSCGKI